MKDFSELIPKYLNRVFSKDEILGSTLPLTKSEHIGVLFTDITSFTAITEEVSKKGHYGVEIITEILNQYFEIMYKAIDKYGGSIIKFGGDSILSVFPGDEKNADNRMNNCLIMMEESLSEINKEFKHKYNIEIAFHKGKKWGKVGTHLVGDREYHLDYYFSGKAISEAHKEDSSSFMKSNELKSIDKSLALEFHKPQFGAKYFIKSNIFDRISSNIFKAELKNAAVIFISLKNKDDHKEINILEYHKFYSTLQKIVYDLKGTVNKIDNNDKGYLILITFGVPDFHRDDIERAFVCCNRILKIPVNKILVRIGLTYGNIFAGILGSQKRYEYGIIGNSVNIAARVMSYANFGEVNVTSEIVPRISYRYEVSYIEKTRVKGIKEDIKIYKVVRELPDVWRAYQKKYKSKNYITNSNNELKFNSFLVSDNNNLLLITGHQGSGKSFSIFKIINNLQMQIVFDLFAPDRYNINNPLYMVKKILLNKLDVSNKELAVKLEEFCSQKQISINETLISKYFSNSNHIFSLKEIEVITENLSSIIFYMLKECNLVVIDNFQWVDNTSTQVLFKTIFRLCSNNIKVILSSRENEIFNVFKKFKPLEFVTKNFNSNLSNRFLKQEVESLSKNVRDKMHHLCKGNPEFLFEMIKTIKKHTQSNQKIFNLKDFNEFMQSGKISMNLENVLIQQYEEFDNSSKEILKLASIIGASFSGKDFDIVNNKQISKHIENTLMQLSGQNILSIRKTYPELKYIFQSRLMRNAIYETILRSEKSDLHNRIALFYEKSYKEDLPEYYEIIANHYILSNNNSKASFYCKLAAEKNFNKASYIESNYYFEKAVQFEENINKKNELILRLAETNIILGNSKLANNNMEAIYLYNDTSSYVHDKIIYIKIRIMEVARDYKKLISYIEDIMPSLSLAEFINRCKLSHINCLRFLNRQDDFEKEYNKFYKRILKSKEKQYLLILLEIYGEYLVNTSEFDAAEQNYLQLKNLSEKNSNLIYLIISLSALGNIYSWKGDQSKALKYYEKAMDISDKIGDRNGYNKAICNIATIKRIHGEFDEAIELYKKSVNISKEIGDRLQEEIALYQIGEGYSIQKEHDAAMSYFSKSLKLAEQLSDLMGISYAYDAISDLYLLQGNYDKAYGMYTKNLSLQKEINDQEGIGHTLGNLGNLALALGHFKEAENYYSKQKVLLNKLGDKIGEGKALINWASLEETKGNIKSAIDKLKKSLLLFESCEDKVHLDLVKKAISDLMKC